MKQPAFCCNCIWYGGKWKKGDKKGYHKCGLGVEDNAITGQPMWVTCEDNRAANGVCGPEGNSFEFFDGEQLEANQEFSIGQVLVLCAALLVVGLTIGLFVGYHMGVKI